ncbi:endolytic transglycosylase MltG [uncultured Bacteroides sp.]|uniref:endolytic transglycosylase MltG n=1 Tax=uncultured Bacteroides sp. TaxID=162156 RepID=UPI00260360AC|nr:endolytic transglycosylase MltG [uncultured Bacteroides sp.]
MKKKKVAYILATLIVIGAACAIAGYALLLNHPVKKEAFIYIDEDDTADSVFVKMEKELQATALSGIKLMASVYDYEQHIHTGAYKFSPDEKSLDIFRRLKNGNQTPVRLTIPSVRTVGNLLRTVSRQLMTDSTSIAQLLSDSAYCARLGYNEFTLPALFIPNTYEVYWNISADDFINRMKKEHERFWNKERTEKAQSIGYTPIEVAILASIVEEETANKAEKPMVAGLYINRLHKEMPLQADPTVKFALQEFGLRRILNKHLEADSPYNTYKHAGLPPGPIRIPSIEGIESVLNYAHHNYLYMCAKEDFSGTHNFASNFSQHQANARRYQQALNARKIMK